MAKPIVVLCGGNSDERDISLLSGAAVVEGLKQAGLNALAVDPKEVELQHLRRGEFEKIFIMLHGRGGEDGSVQGMLELLGFPYTGSGILASSLALDKWRSKMIWQALGLPIIPYELIQRGDSSAAIERSVARFGFPLAIKPIDQGSSLGVSKVVDRDSIPVALEEAFRYGENALIEQWIEGEEYTFAILGDQVLPSVRIKPAVQFYDYQAKYLSDDTQYYCPSGLPAERERELGFLAMQAYRALGCCGWGRVDLVSDKQQNFYLLEVNTVPGMTTHSLVPMAARESGMTFSQLVVKILELSDG